MTQPIAIIGAMAQEVALLKDALTHSHTKTIAGTDIHTGIFKNKPVVVMQSGIGKVNAALATTLLIEHESPSHIINTGSAGGLASTLAVGDVVVASHCYYHDVDVTAFGYTLGQMAGMPFAYKSDEALLTLAKKNINGNCYIGDMISGDRFIHGKASSTIRTQFPNALAIDMESTAIAQVCYAYDLPFVVVRAISDLADSDASQSFETFLELASVSSSNMVLQMIANSNL